MWQIRNSIFIKEMSNMIWLIFIVFNHSVWVGKTADNFVTLVFSNIYVFIMSVLVRRLGFVNVCLKQHF